MIADGVPIVEKVRVNMSQQLHASRSDRSQLQDLDRMMAEVPG